MRTNDKLDDVTASDDPVLIRRAQVARWSAMAKRAGYLTILVAMIVFVIGFATEFGPAVTGIIVGCLVASAVLLIPALIFGYGVKAAEREDAGEPFRY
ncbi:MAG TPA: hypothetical protein PKY13_00355 [Microthrixaceae bacterium]|jgi:hypothetical protein|nr:hypothetical protein [Microthrixaceae bacterium]HQF92567.1 hypothetical protein [Microthrixaceae bacterium]